MAVLEGSPSSPVSASARLEVEVDTRFGESLLGTGLVASRFHSIPLYFKLTIVLVLILPGCTASPGPNPTTSPADPPPPAAPMNLTAVATSGTHITLTWSAS